MRVFSCQVCCQRVYFDNVRCERCFAELGYLPDRAQLHALRPVEGDTGWVPINGGIRRYQRCRNWTDYDVCNWMVPASEFGLCLACRLNEVIPDLTSPGNVVLWSRLEAAKRRLVYSLLAFGLPVVPKHVAAEKGLAFRFLADPEPGGDTSLSTLTGHDGGVITINLAEADPAAREGRRVALHEPYRTLVGHLRHESGHYYWDRLVASNDSALGEFRERFGDDRANYQEALDRYYREGPVLDWQERFVSTYASVHPWEDWAETWAHYLHLVDTLETAESVGVRIGATAAGSRHIGLSASFDDMLSDWVPLTGAINELNRSMGEPDLYPFVVSASASDKLRFVHQVLLDQLDRIGDEWGSDVASQIGHVGT
jgi:hypothetical protein